MLRAEMRFAGSGGQGIILASKIVSEAAGIFEGYNVVQTQIYGAAARGELSRADVIIDDGNIYTLEIISADLLLCMSQEAYDAYRNELKENGIIVLDDFYVKNYDKLNSRYLGFPITRTARDKFNNPLVSNIIGVGILTVLGGFFKEDNVRKAVKKRVPKDSYNLNMDALETGFDLGKKKRTNLCSPIKII